MNINRNFSSIEQVTGAYYNHKTQQTPSKDGQKTSFNEILKEKGEKLKFSKHAGARLEERNITLSDEQMKRLEKAAVRAEQKGINESLILMDNMAFIINVKNSTVITAMEQADSKENVFTNIDGTVII